MALGRLVWRRGAADMEDNDMRRLCARAGVTADEMLDHPQYGLLLSASATRKLAALAEDQGKAQAVRDQVAKEVRTCTIKTMMGGIDPVG